MKCGQDRILSCDGDTFTVPQQVYYDFEANSEFIGWYIRLGDPTAFLAEGLADTVHERLNEVRNGIGVSLMIPGEGQSLGNAALKFSGRAYIYHEAPLTIQEQARLDDVFTKRGLSLVLRGPSYATARSMAESVSRPAVGL